MDSGTEALAVGSLLARPTSSATLGEFLVALDDPGRTEAPAEGRARAVWALAAGERVRAVSVPATGSVPPEVDVGTDPVGGGDGDTPTVVVPTGVVTPTVVLGSVTGTVTTGVDTVVPVGTGTVGTDTVGTGTVGAGTVGAGTVGAGTVGTGTVGTGTVGTGTVGTDTVGTGTVASVGTDTVTVVRGVDSVRVGTPSAAGWLPASTFAAKKPATAMQTNGITARRVTERSQPK